MNMMVRYQETGLPLDLTECTAITVSIPNADGTFTDLTLADSQVEIQDPLNYGQIAVIITNEESSLFNVGERQNIDVLFVIGGLNTIVRFVAALTVLESPV
jgi:hypothetical protein